MEAIDLTGMAAAAQVGLANALEATLNIVWH